MHRLDRSVTRPPNTITLSPFQSNHQKTNHTVKKYHRKNKRFDGLMKINLQRILCLAKFHKNIDFRKVIKFFTHKKEAEILIDDRLRWNDDTFKEFRYSLSSPLS